jgi:hypothetical protein
MVAGQLSEGGQHACVVCAGANNAQREDGTARSVRIRVVAELAQRLDDGQLRIRGAQQGQGQWDSAADDGLAIAVLKTESK